MGFSDDGAVHRNLRCHSKLNQEKQSFKQICFKSPNNIVFLICVAKDQPGYNSKTNRYKKQAKKKTCTGFSCLFVP